MTFINLFEKFLEIIGSFSPSIIVWFHKFKQTDSFWYVKMLLKATIYFILVGNLIILWIKGERVVRTDIRWSFFINTFNLLFFTFSHYFLKNKTGVVGNNNYPIEKYQPLDITGKMDCCENI